MASTQYSPAKKLSMKFDYRWGDTDTLDEKTPAQICDSPIGVKKTDNDENEGDRSSDGEKTDDADLNSDSEAYKTEEEDGDKHDTESNPDDNLYCQTLNETQRNMNLGLNINANILNEMENIHCETIALTKHVLETPTSPIMASSEPKRLVPHATLSNNKKMQNCTNLKLYGLPISFQSKDLYELLKPYGPFKHIFLVYERDKGTGQIRTDANNRTIGKGIAYVEFQTKEMAEKCMSEMQGTRFPHTALVIECAQPRPPSKYPGSLVENVEQKSQQHHGSYYTHGCYLVPSGSQMYFIPEKNHYLAWQAFLMERGLQVDYWKDLMMQSSGLPQHLSACNFMKGVNVTLLESVIFEILGYERLLELSGISNRFMLNQYTSGTLIEHDILHSSSAENSMRIESSDGCLSLHFGDDGERLNPRKLDSFCKKFLKGQWLYFDPQIWSTCKAMHSIVILHIAMKIDQWQRFPKQYRKNHWVSTMSRFFTKKDYLVPLQVPVAIENSVEQKEKGQKKPSSQHDAQPTLSHSYQHPPVPTTKKHHVVKKDRLTHVQSALNHEQPQQQKPNSSTASTLFAPSKEEGYFYSVLESPDGTTSISPSFHQRDFHYPALMPSLIPSFSQPVQQPNLSPLAYVPGPTASFLQPFEPSSIAPLNPFMQYSQGCESQATTPNSSNRVMLSVPTQSTSLSLPTNPLGLHAQSAGYSIHNHPPASSNTKIPISNPFAMIPFGGSFVGARNHFTLPSPPSGHVATTNTLDMQQKVTTHPMSMMYHHHPSVHPSISPLPLNSYPLRPTMVMMENGQVFIAANHPMQNNGMTNNNNNNNNNNTSNFGYTGIPNSNPNMFTFQ